MAGDVAADAATAPRTSPPADDAAPAAATSGAPWMLPRAIGTVRLAVKRRDERTALAALRHQGSAKALFPRTFSSGTGAAPLDGVLLNTAGGVAGGDRFDYQATAEAGTWLRLSSQTAERGYRARAGEIGRIDVRLRAASRARIDWTPQETILFDDAAIARRLEADLAEDAAFLAVEPIVLGRGAMGERVRGLRFSDQWRVRLGGRLVYADAMRLVGDAERIAARSATFGGARAAASLVYVGSDAGRRVASLRELLADTDGASLVRSFDGDGGVLAARLIAADGYALRRRLIPVLEHLGDAPIPKVWSL